MQDFKRVVLMLGLLLAATAAQAGTPPEWAPLAFLLGQWDAENSGAPGEASGSTTFALELQGRVMVRTNFAEYPASARGPASRHDDLMVIFAEAGTGIQANFYDSEGHVIHYVASVDSAGTVSFVSDIAEGSPRFRLIYRLQPEGLLAGEFAMAPPGQPEAFTPYLAWVSRRAEAGDGAKP